MTSYHCRFLSLPVSGSVSDPAQLQFTSLCDSDVIATVVGVLISGGPYNTTTLRQKPACFDGNEGTPPEKRESHQSDTSTPFDFTAVHTPYMHSVPSNEYRAR